MKRFRKIYYICISVIAVLFFVLSIASIHLGSGSNTIQYDNVYTHIKNLTAIGAHNYLEPTLRDEARDYILRELGNSGLVQNDYEILDEDNLLTDSYDTVDYVNNQPTYILQRTSPNQQSNNLIANATGNVYAGNVVNNIIVAFPSKTTASGGRSSNAIVLHTSYDTGNNHKGAMSVNADVAVMLETIKELKSNNIQSDNDIIFIFGENYETNLGLFLYANQFDGFRNIADRTKLAIGTFGFGTSGQTQLYETSENNLALLKNLALSGSGSDSVFSYLHTNSQHINNELPFSFSWANYGNFGDSSFSKSPTDDLEGVTKSTINSKANLLNNSIKKLSNINLNTLNTDSTGLYYGYLGANITLPLITMLVFGILILMLAVLAIILLVRNHHTSLKSIFNSLIVGILSLVGVGVALLAFYYLVGMWLLVGYGIMPLQMLNTFVFTNPLLLIVLFILSATIYNAFVALFKKMFNAKSNDVARANVLILAVVAAILAFVIPSFAYPFVILSVLQTIAMLFVAIFKNKYRKKHNEDIDRLFLYFLPVIITLPITIPAFMSATVFVALPYWALLGTIFATMFGTIIPYFGMLEKKLDAMFAKLPAGRVTLITKETVVENITAEQIQEIKDSGKKTALKPGQPVKRQNVITSIEKRKLKYHNYLLTTLVTIIAGILFFVGASNASNFGVRAETIAYPHIYQSSMVFVHEQVGSSTNIFWEIKDKNAYNTIHNAVDGFHYNDNTQSYTLDIARARDGFSAASKSNNGTNGASYTLFGAGYNSQVEIIAKDTTDIEKFTITAAGSEYIYENTHRLNKIKFDLPFYFGNASQIDIVAEGSGSVKYEFTQYSYERGELNNYTEWSNLQSYLNDNNLQNQLSGGLVFRIID